MKTHPIHHSDGSTDHRYALRQEWCGDALRKWVVRFDGEWVGASPFYSSALMLAIGHNASRLGALTVTAQPAEANAGSAAL